MYFYKGRQNGFTIFVGIYFNMKKIIVILIAAVLLISLVSVTRQEFSIVGKWNGQEQGGTLVQMIFDDEGYVIMKRNDEVIGGKDFKIKGEKFSMFYKIDDDKKPMQLDVTVTRHSTGAQRKMFGIYKVINRDKIVIYLTERVRPGNFENPQAITFVRQ